MKKEWDAHRCRTCISFLFLCCRSVRLLHGLDTCLRGGDKVVEIRESLHSRRMQRMWNMGQEKVRERISVERAKGTYEGTRERHSTVGVAKFWLLGGRV